jgi:thiol-disulfide isomerase/thioredoxin
VFADMTELENPFGPRQPKRRNWIAVLAALIAVVALGTNYTVYLAADRAEQRAATLESQVTDLQYQLATLQASLADTQARLQLTESSPAPSAGQITIAQDLPRYPDSGQDTALGLTLAPVTGAWYPDGSVRSIDPADGIARAWVVWAHWCPYCQQELPIVKSWYEENAGNNPHLQIVSITTAIDNSASNPLVPYLEAQDFPFPVIVDASGALSAQFGVSAFPFWVFTGPDGTVLGRTAGLLPEEQLAAFFEQLEAIGSEAS